MDYPKVIKHPMDLGQIQQKMDRGDYSSPLEFERDMNLVWNNCMTYNLVCDALPGLMVIVICVCVSAMDCCSSHSLPLPPPPQDGSEYFVLAQNLKKLFEEKFSKIKIDSSMWL